MNIRNSGKIPEKIKKLAAVIAVMAVALFAGCNGVTDPDGSIGSETSVGESVPSYTSDDSSTHEPIESSSDATDSSGYTESSDASDSTTPESSSDIGDVSSDDPFGGSNGSTSSDKTDSSPGSSSTPPPISSTPPAGSSTLPSSSSSVKPEPPVVVTVPDFPVPTSPGTNVANASKGWIDYSNASKGYISAKYTGSKSKLKLRIQCAGYEKPYDHDVTPGITEYFPLSLGTGDYTVTLYENTQGSDYTKVVSCSFTVNISSLQPFTYSNRYSVYNSSSNCVYKAAELCAGKSGTIDKIAAIFEWVTSNVKYDYDLAATVQSGYVPDPDRTFKSKTGICFDYASLMCAMLRSQGIPTRLVIGWASPDIYHAWNEVYTEETGWITPELMLKKAGWNLVDSTFYASSSNKSQIASYISNSSNYTVRYYY